MLLSTRACCQQPAFWDFVQKKKKSLLSVKALRPFHLVLTSTEKKCHHFSDVLSENKVCYVFVKMSANSFEFQFGSAPRSFSVCKVFKIKSGLRAALTGWLILRGFDLDMTQNAILHCGKWPQMTTYTSTFPVLPVFSINHNNMWLKWNTFNTRTNPEQPEHRQQICSFQGYEHLRRPWTHANKTLISILSKCWKGPGGSCGMKITPCFSFP